MPKQLFVLGLGVAFGAGAGFYAGFYLGFGNALGELKKQMDDQILYGEGQNERGSEERPQPSDYPDLPHVQLHQP